MTHAPSSFHGMTEVNKTHEISPCVHDFRSAGFVQRGNASAIYEFVRWGFLGRLLAKPRVILYGAEEDAFYKNMKDVMFLRNDYAAPINPSALDDNVQWLKDHPDVRFYVNGYASITGDIVYNLALSQRRADWVKQTLINRGIPENRIVVAAGWGELYPVCAEDTQECRDRNKLVRFIYCPSR